MKVGLEDLKSYVVVLDNLGNYCSDHFAGQESVVGTVEAIEVASNIMNSLANQLEQQELDF
jgi:hypothetical protein